MTTGATEGAMAEQQQQQELAVREKRELTAKEERTVPGRFYVPPTDVWETEDALAVVLEVPGVARDAVEIELKEGVLRVEARVDPARYGGLEPVYTEYDVGHWARAFALPDAVDRGRIEARLEDGVLTLTLPKVAEARPRRIALA